jgi:hypothetical protein
MWLLQEIDDNDSGGERVIDGSAYTIIEIAAMEEG